MSGVEAGIAASLMGGMNTVTVPESLALCYGSLKTHGPGGYNSLARDYSTSLLARLGVDTLTSSRHERKKVGSLDIPLLRYDLTSDKGNTYVPLNNPTHLFYK